MSVRKRGNHWIVTIYDKRLGRNRWVGTRPSKGRVDGDPEYEAKALEHKALTERQKSPSETCDSFANRWIRDYPRPKESSNRAYAERVKKFATDFQGVRLTELSAAEVERWALDNKGRVHAVRAMFTDARRARLIDHNPFLGLRLSSSQGRKHIQPPSEEDVLKLAEHAEAEWGPNYFAWVMCAAYTGIRPGEMSNLRWSDIDWGHQEYVNGKPVGDPFPVVTVDGSISKNGRSRMVTLLDQAADALAMLPRDGEFIFESVDGKRMSRQTWTNYWHRVRKKAGFPTLHFYMLRHACASYLLNTLELAPQDVAQQLGHTDGGVLVQGLYGHPSEGLARQRIRRANVSRLVPLRPAASANGEQTAEDAR